MITSVLLDSFEGEKKNSILLARKKHCFVSNDVGMCIFVIIVIVFFFNIKLLRGSVEIVPVNLKIS